MTATADRPLSASEIKRMKRTPPVKIVRRALGLTQEEFAARYRIPLGTLRDWEQGRSDPDQPARAYLRVIAAEPAMTARALTTQVRGTPQGRRSG
jgi:putative transcriptional regulator